MTDILAEVSSVSHGKDVYEAIKVWCPGCDTLKDSTGSRSSGLHMLPISGDVNARPTWEWNGDLVKVTLNPSILTKYRMEEKGEFVCHSFLRNGIWEFLNDCTHELAGQKVPMVPLPKWALN